MILLFIPIAIEKLKKLCSVGNEFNENYLIEKLTFLLSLAEEKVLKEWLGVKKFANNAPWGEQCRILLDYLSTLPKSEWPADIDLDIKQDLERQKIEKEMLQNRGLRGNVFLLLQLIEFYRDI